MMSYFIRSNGDHSYWSRHSKVWIRKFPWGRFLFWLQKKQWIIPV